MSRWLKEPLIHFLLIGGLIFVLYGRLAGKVGAPDQIIVSRGQQETLINTFARTWQRTPTPEEFQSLLDDYVREEIAYREGRAMGLEQDDIIIRRRMRQKLELLAEDVASLAEPTEADLQAWLADHPDEFLIEPRLTLRQIYFSRDRRGDAAVQDASEALQQLSGQGIDADTESFGDPIPLPADVEDLPESEIARLFGQVFVDQLQTLGTGRWSGPVESGFGIHLVFVEDREPSRLPALDEVRDSVQRDWLSQRRREALDALYDRLAKNYTVEIEPLVAPEAAGQDSP